jgi:GntR family transcriptional regulator
MIVHGAEERRNHVRRLRDVLRANILRGFYVDSKLPDDSTLIAEHGVTRKVLRDALVVLRAEGLIYRVQGRGTFVRTAQITHPITDFDGTSRHIRTGAWENISATAIVSRRIVATPDVVARLMPGVGPICLLVDWTAHSGTEIWGVSTSYIRYPEATLLETSAIGSNFWVFLSNAGIKAGKATTILGAAIADEYDAEVLGIEVGSAIITIDALTSTLTGEPFELGFRRLRADRQQIEVTNAGYDSLSGRFMTGKD